MTRSNPQRHDREIDVRNRAVDRAVLESDVAAVALSPARLDAFVRSALRLRAWEARRVLAHGLDPDVSFEELLSNVRSASVERIAEDAYTRRSPFVAAETLGAWWRALGRVVALQGLDETDGLDGLRLHDIARVLFPVSSWAPADALTYAQLLWINGQGARLRQDEELLAALDSNERLSLEVDLAADAEGVGSVSWNEALARMLAIVAGVTVDADAPTPFDGLRPISIPKPVDGPLVSIIMSAYHPGPEILTSVRSILNQSWTNLELLVVDDASGPEYIDILDRVAALDPRVRVLIQPENRGTYGARNRALSETRGDFVTFQDSDDWSHPERIARQAQRLLDDPTLPAIMSRSIRCTPDLKLQLLGYRTTRPNVSSLMLRRSTIETLGYFDHVRKAADTEYQLRIAAHYSRRVTVMPDLLAFVRLDPGSLSRSDFKPGWWHPARHAYRDGFQRWHRAISSGAASWLSPSAEVRKFPAPRAFLRGTGHQPDHALFDLLFVADWRELGGAQSALLQQVHSAVARGRRVGVMHLESPRALDCVSETICRDIGDLLFEGVVTQVLPDDPVIVGRLLLGDPAVLNYAPDRMPAVQVHEVVVLASSPPSEPTSSPHRYDAASVTSVVKAVWGVDPVWIPGGERVRTALAGIVGVSVASTDLPAGLTLETSMSRSTRRARPIIGAVIGAGEDGVPATSQELLALLPDDQAFDVRLIAAPPRLSQLLDPVPDHWLLYRPDDITQRAFYRQIDFFISSTGTQRVDQVVPRVIDAVSAGAVAVVPPSFAGVLGDAAVYAAADEVSDVVRRLFVDPDEYAAVVARAQASVREQFPSALAEQSLPGILQIDGRQS
ncbi:glycosyltransferase family 2 protein [Microbacterium sp. I2]|uniref:glycosyltransferase family 2 protein n=1 Tax=Microbacterium sp. I2 TaxID=3391826 RepID=UPI003EDA87E9